MMKTWAVSGRLNAPAHVTELPPKGRIECERLVVMDGPHALLAYLRRNHHTPVVITDSAELLALDGVEGIEVRQG